MDVLIEKGGYSFTLHLKEDQEVTVDRETFVFSEGRVYCRFWGGSVFHVLEGEDWFFCGNSAKRHFSDRPYGEAIGLYIETHINEKV